jgi:hypothetical protein
MVWAEDPIPLEAADHLGPPRATALDASTGEQIGKDAVENQPLQAAI